MDNEDLRKILPRDFFTRPMPHKTEKDSKEDMIPMKWTRFKLMYKIKHFLFKNRTK